MGLACKHSFISLGILNEGQQLRILTLELAAVKKKREEDRKNVVFDTGRGCS